MRVQREMRESTAGINTSNEYHKIETRFVVGFGLYVYVYV